MAHASQTPSEQDARLRYITPAIQEAGWENENIWTERSIIFDESDGKRDRNIITDGRVVISGNQFARQAGLKPDYILCDNFNHYLAVVEAKSGIKSLDDGIQQAINYAEMLDVKFAYSSNGKAFIEHDFLKGERREIPLDKFPSPEELKKRLQENDPLTPDQEKIVNTPYYFDPDSGQEPRYYQRVAIDRTVKAIAKGQQRVLLVMATGTGKTYTAFQIIHCLHKSGAKKKILYLADRNILIDQTMDGDFKSFHKVMTKVQNAEIDPAYEIYMALYPQLVGDEEKGEPDPFLQVKKSFFDLIIVDECHRGSAREDSAWRKVLNYFSSATQIGMTATPKAEEGANNYEYFGDPIYTYSLKQGIADGFLAPYRVTSIKLNIDESGYQTKEGERDKYNNTLEKSLYVQKEFGDLITIESRQKLVAKKITEMLCKIDRNRMTKTIVFCKNTDEAGRMCNFLTNENSDRCKKNPKYVMRITGNDEIGKKQLKNFIAVDQKYPTVVTTSELLSTGVDCKTCGLIVIDKEINSMTEFKQIIGRGTRLLPEKGKWHLEILDFRGATSKFSDPEFDGEPLPPDAHLGDGEDEGDGREGGGKGGTSSPSPNLWEKRVVEGEKYTINEEVVTLYNERGKAYQEVPVAEFAKEQILKNYPTLESFKKRWNEAKQKKDIISELREYSVLIEAVVEQNCALAQVDLFDVICSVAYAQNPLTRRQRADRVENSDFFASYDEGARNVLKALLANYVAYGIINVEDPDVLRTPPFNEIGTPPRIERLFEKVGGFEQALHELEQELYKVK